VEVLQENHRVAFAESAADPPVGAALSRHGQGRIHRDDVPGADESE